MIYNHIDAGINLRKYAEKIKYGEIRFAVEISNSSVEKLWELLLGDGFFEFLPSLKNV